MNVLSETHPHPSLPLEGEGVFIGKSTIYSQNVPSPLFKGRGRARVGMGLSRLT
jgi:hypothetical protein